MFPTSRRRQHRNQAQYDLPEEDISENTAIMGLAGQSSNKSMQNIYGIARTESAVSEFPETAAIGETLDACFAGDCAASRTVTIPTIAPLISPTGLKANTGIVAYHYGNQTAV